MSIKRKIKKYIPLHILTPLQNIIAKIKRNKEENLINIQPKLHQNAIKKIRAKHGPINVVFFAIFDSVWKYDHLYKIMEKDNRFNPIIVVCPVVNYGKENMLQNMNKCYNLFKSKDYNVIRAYDVSTKKYINVRKELNPDIIFYTNPYKGLIDGRYYIDKYRDILTCYVNYYFCTETKLYDIAYDRLFYNLLWKKYIESPFEKKLAERYARNKGINMTLTGYPGIDQLIDTKYIPKEVWKKRSVKTKRIIWAPHHSINNYAFVNYSTFLKYYDVLLKLAEKYKDSIQISFKPHPLLKNRLYLDWGKERTDKYYETWRLLENGQLDEGEYIDLFLTSDAIIHDSGSFIFEYLITGKPAMHLNNGIPYDINYNEYAQEALSCYYTANNEEDIEEFIINVINNKDEKKEERLKFIQSNLYPPNNNLASQNIINDLVKSLDIGY